MPNLFRNFPVYLVVAKIQGQQNGFWKLHLAQIKLELISRQDNLLCGLGPAEQKGSVADEVVARQVNLNKLQVAKVSRDLPRQLVVREAEVGLRGLGEEIGRQSPPELVPAEINVEEVVEGGKGLRDPSVEIVEGEIELCQFRQGEEKVGRDGA